MLKTHVLSPATYGDPLSPMLQEVTLPVGLQALLIEELELGVNVNSGEVQQVHIILTYRS